MEKKTLAIWTPIVLAVVAAPFLFLGDIGWNSPCACMGQNDMFASWTKTRRGTLFDPEQGPKAVVEGLEPRIRGVEFDKISSGHPIFARTTCQRVGNAQVCQFWLEKKSTRERGYELSFALAKDNTVQAVRSARIIHKGGT
jgi:hypothetical protein